jgi:hypothetical protein
VPTHLVAVWGRPTVASEARFKSLAERLHPCSKASCILPVATAAQTDQEVCKLLYLFRPGAQVM